MIDAGEKCDVPARTGVELGKNGVPKLSSSSPPSLPPTLTKEKPYPSCQEAEDEFTECYELASKIA